MLNGAVPILIALLLASLVEGKTEPLPPGLKLFGITIGIGQAIALYWRHSHPRTVMALTTLGGLGIQLLAPYGLFPYAGLVALYSFTTTRSPRASLPALAGLLAVTALNWWTAVPGDAQFALAVVVAVWALAEATRSRRVAIGQAATRATAQEQARLARELHDVIAHSVSVIVVQAAAADDVFEHSPARARTALRSIEATGREALAELRRLLAAIGPEPDADGSRQPQPGLDRLEELAEPLRALGLIVRIHRHGDDRNNNDRPDIDRTNSHRIGDDATVDDPPVPIGVALSVYRIVQEALTNVVRHAQAGQVDIDIRTEAGIIQVAIQDDGRGSAPSSSPTTTGATTRATTGSTTPTAASSGQGRGLAGMRERAALLGGTLEAGPRAEGGFLVEARLPLSTPL